MDHLRPRPTTIITTVPSAEAVPQRVPTTADSLPHPEEDSPAEVEVDPSPEALVVAADTRAAVAAADTRAAVADIAVKPNPYYLLASNPSESNRYQPSRYPLSDQHRSLYQLSIQYYRSEL